LCDFWPVAAPRHCLTNPWWVLGMRQAILQSLLRWPALQMYQGGKGFAATGKH
jgi:hypothetical protein